MKKKRRVGRERRLVEFRFIYDDGSTRLVDVPELDLGRSGDEIDVMVFFAKRNRSGDPRPPDRMVRTGRRRDALTGELI